MHEIIFRGIIVNNSKYAFLLLVASLTFLQAQDDLSEFDLSEFGVSFEEPAPPVVLEPEPVPVPVYAPGQEPAPIGLPLEIPYLGTVTLFPYTEGKEDGLKAKLPSTAKKIELGPLVIDDGELKTLESKFSYTARAKLFGKEVRIGFQDVTDLDKIPLGVYFIPGSKPVLELIPGARAELDSATVLLEKNKPLTMVAGTRLFGQPVDLLFTINTKEQSSDVKAEMNNISFVSLIPQVKDTPLAESTIKQLSLRTVNLYTKDPAKKLQVILEGKADLSGVPGLEAAKDTTLQGRFDAKGLYIEIIVPALAIPGAGTVNNGRLVIDFTEGQRNIALSGVTKIDIPSVGSFEVLLASHLSKTGIELDGTVKDVVSYAGITIPKAHVLYSTQDKVLALEGEAEIRGQKINVRISKDAKGNVSVQGSVVDGKPLKPFEALHLPIVSDISLLPTRLRIEKNDQGAQIATTGKVTLFGIPLTGDLQFKKTPAGDVTLLIVKAPAGWKLSDGITQLKGTLFDGIALKNLYFMISSADYTGEITDEAGKVSEVKFQKGINFLAEASLTGALAPVAALTGTDPELVITVAGAYNPEPYSVTLKAYIPATLDLQFAQVGKLTLEVVSTLENLPTIALVTNVITTSGGDKLEFSVRIMVEPTKASLAGTMAGIWNKPFGIPGLQIGNVAIQADFVPLPPALPPLPGVTGSLCIGGQMVKGAPRCAQAQAAPPSEPLCKDGFGACMAVKFPDVLSGEADSLTIADLVKIALNLVQQKFNTNLLPDIGLREVKIYIVPKQTSIGEFKFERGFNVKGKLNILGFEAYLAASIGGDGIRGEGRCSKLAFGPLLITGVGPDGKWNTPDDGPIVRLTLTATPLPLGTQEFLLSGLLKLDPLFSIENYVRINRDGAEFKFEYKIGGDALLYASVLGKTSGAITDNTIDFTLTVEFQQQLLSVVRDGIDKGLKPALDQVNRDMNKAIAVVNTLSATKKEADQKIEAARRDVQNAKNSMGPIRAASKEANDVLAAQQRVLDGYSDDIRRLQKNIDDETNKFNASPWYEQAYKWAELSGKVVAWGAELAARQIVQTIGKQVLAAANAVAQGVLIASEQTAQASLVAADGFLDKVGQPVASGTLTAVQAAGAGVLDATKQATLGTMQGGAFVVKAAASIVDIQKIYFQGSVRNLTGGKLGKVNVQAMLFGQQVNLGPVDLDVSNAPAFIAAVVNKAVQQVQAGFNQLDVLVNARNVTAYEKEIQALVDQQVVNIQLAQKAEAQAQAAGTQLAAAQKVKQSSEMAALIASGANREQLLAQLTKEVEVLLEARAAEINKQIAAAKNDRNRIMQENKARKEGKDDPTKKLQQGNVLRNDITIVQQQLMAKKIT